MAKQDDYRELSFLRAARKRRQLCKVGGIIVSEATAEDYRNQFCGGCGKRSKNPKRYFGELFCFDCVSKWQNGKR